MSTALRSVVLYGGNVVGCSRELVNQHSDNLKTLMMHAVYNELSNSRNPNNMSLLSTMFNHSPELSARVSMLSSVVHNQVQSMLLCSDNKL